MLRHRLSMLLAVCIFSWFPLQSSGFNNPWAPFFPDPGKIQPHSKTTGHHGAGCEKAMAPGSASISGTVNYPGSASYAYVMVIDTFGWEVGDVTTNGSGSYTVSGLYPGVYLVMACTDYQARYRTDGSGMTYLGNTTAIAGATWLRVSQGQALTNQNITVAAAQQQKVFVSGTCYRGSGTASPIANGSLSFDFVNADKPSSVNSANGYCSTDLIGAFACTVAVAAGNYYVKIGISTYGTDTSYVPQWWDGQSVSAEPVAAAIGSSVAGKTIHFEMGGRISGVVKDPSGGAPVSSVLLEAIDRDGFILGECSLYPSSASDTFFSIGQLPSGPYFIETVNYSGDYATTYYPLANVIDSATAVTVTAGSTVQGISIPLRRNSGSVVTPGPTGTISGKITRQDNNAAIPSTSVSFSTGSESLYGGISTTTDSLGNYYRSVTADSSYYIHTGDETVLNLWAASAEYYLMPTWYPGVTDITAATKVKVSQGQAVTVNMAVQQGGSIAGWVKTAANTGFPSYLQSIYGTGEMVVGYVWTGDFSHVSVSYVQNVSGFRFCGVVPGSYTARFISYAYDLANQIIGETDHAYAGAKGIVVTQENTAFGQALTLPDGSARITGAVGPDPQRTQQPFMSAIFCYAADSIIAGLSESLGYMTGYGGGSSQRALFFTRDNSPSSAAQRQWNYTVGKLVPGKYALARMELDTQAVAYFRQWYGTSTWERINYNPTREYYHQFLKPDIPAATWITLTANQTQAGVNFGNVGILRPANAAAAGRPELRLVKTLSKKAILQYSLPVFDKSKPAALSIYRSDGTRVRTIALRRPSGTIAWDGTTGRTAAASAGVYVFRLTYEGCAVTVKGAWIK